MSHQHLDSNWHNWVQHNLNRGCDALELAAILGQHGFRGDSIGSALGGGGANALASKIDHMALSQVNITRINDSISQVNQTIDEGQTALLGLSASPALAIPMAKQPAVPQQVVTDKLQLYTIPHFLSEAECDRVAALVNQCLRPSTLTIYTADDSYRNSKTSDLCLIDDPIVGLIDNRIADTLGIQLLYAEGTQAQRYDVGEQFKQHTDFFEPGTSEYDQFAGSRGNRTWTFMIYLNAVEQGGGTRFFSIDSTFIPEKGLALAWNNLYSNGCVNPNTLHAGLPVEAGYKIIITKWFRELGNGPLFSA